MYSLVLALAVIPGADVPANDWPVQTCNERPRFISISKEVYTEYRPAWSLRGFLNRLFHHHQGEYVSYPAGPVITSTPHVEPIPVPVKDGKPITGKPGGAD